MIRPRLDAPRPPGLSMRITPARALLCLLAPFAFLSWASLIGAQEVIHYRSAERSGGRATVFGKIVEFGGATLRVRLNNGRAMQIDSERILSIETERTSQQAAGDDSFARQNYRLALTDYRAALENEKRDWVRREILAQAVRCYNELGDTRSAADTFSVLYARHPTLAEFASIPLVWIPQQPPRQLAAAADEWIKQQDAPAETLIGASLLLATRRRDDAIRRLRTLLAHEDERIAWMAQAQVWRSEVASVSELEIQNWEQAVDRIPDPLRAGPYVVIGAAWSARGAHDKAALAWLRVPILHGQDRALSAYALGTAGRALETVGDFDGAGRLYLETIEHYADTPAAEQSRERLKQGLANQDAADQP